MSPKILLKLFATILAISLADISVAAENAAQVLDPVVCGSRIEHNSFDPAAVDKTGSWSI